MAGKRRKTLDENRPYGRVCGVSEACFEQDGILFDTEKKQIFEKEIPKTTSDDSGSEKSGDDVNKTPLEEHKGGLFDKVKEALTPAKKEEAPKDDAANDSESSEIDDQLSSQNTVA